MAKKRRNVASPVTQRASPHASSRETQVDQKYAEKSLDTLRSYYDQLGGEVAGVPTSLERTLLFQSVVVLGVQNGLMVVETVSASQIAVMIGTIVWLARKSILSLFLPQVNLEVGGNRELFLRGACLALAVCGLSILHFQDHISLNILQTLALMVAFFFDALSIFFLKISNCRLTRGQIWLSAVEISYLVTGFSMCFNMEVESIFDEFAFFLVTATAFVHAVVLLTAKSIVLDSVGSVDEAALMMTKQRGALLMERLWADIDRFESVQLLAGVSRKKKTKSKSRANTLKNCITDNSSSTHQATWSVFNKPSIQLAVLTLVQILLLASQGMLSSSFLFTWELISGLMLSSTYVLWKLGQVRRNVLSRRVITLGGPKVKSE